MRRFLYRHRIFVITVVALILVKVGWVAWSCWGNGSFDDEKEDILQRRNYLVEKIVVEPKQLMYADIALVGEAIALAMRTNYNYCQD